ncbi:50S ribosome-binding GTPase, partial [archaeon]|nr:50S ribosome-binding GTPase [archaeon]
MPANVTAEFEISRKKYEDAKTDDEKLNALQEMLRTSPKHKGSEALIRDITKKIGELRHKMEKQKVFEKARTKKSGASLTVRKEGAGQIALVGAPNSGKSSLVKLLTKAEVEIAPYAFTTVTPVSGMMDFKGAKVQLVDLPAVIEGSSSGKMQGTQVLSIVRNADAILMPVRSANEFKVNVEELAKAGIQVVQAKPNIQIGESKFGGINFAGKEFLNCSEVEAKSFVKGLGFDNITLVLFEKTSLRDLSDALDSRIVFKKALVACFDRQALDEARAFMDFILLERVRERLREEIEKQAVSRLKPKIRESLRERLLEWFDREKSIELQKRLRKWMKEKEQDKVEGQIERELTEKLNAKLDSM